MKWPQVRDSKNDISSDSPASERIETSLSIRLFDPERDRE